MSPLYIFVLLGLVNACILFILLHKGRKDRDRIAAVKALFATGHYKNNKCKKTKKYAMYLSFIM